MLYTYKHINHDFEKIQKYIEHLVLNVWCKPNGNFLINKLHPDFVPIVNGVNPRYLKNPIKNVYRICNGLLPAQLLKLRNGFLANNSIEELCMGMGTPLLYSEIYTIRPALKRQLELFFKNLYSKVPQIIAFKKVCGEIDDYYDKLVDTNEKCPFCGINDILTPKHSKRDALDHYLPKDIYPFNSVNPNNLAPICKTCNSSYKGTNSPIRDNIGVRRKAFYPFAKKAVKLEFKAKFNCTSILKMKKEDVELKITNSRYKEQIETWDSLFGIKERYAIKLSSKDARGWLNTMLIDFKINPKTKYKSFAKKMEYYENNPMEDNNFLRVTYFNACKQMGVFN